jgi:SpoVK/Ycf46/Vps4 family AAA+-type ATPase
VSVSADHITALVRAHAAEDESGFYSIALQVAASAARNGQNRFADDLKNLIDTAKAERIPRATPTLAITRRGDLADLVTTEYPEVRLSDLTLAPVTRAQLERVLHEQRQRGLLESHGFAPLHRLLLTGPAGTGKSMTASALATELSLPLVTIRIEALISKYTGETAAKLRVIFDALAHPRTVYLFDDLDAIGARQMTGFDFDIVDARRVLNLFLSFLDDTQPESLIVAVTDHRSQLDDVLLRRFDAVIAYYLPDPAQALDVLRRRLGTINTSAVAWNEVAHHVRGISQAGLVRAAESAAKQAILSNSDSLSTAVLVTSLGELRKIHPVMGFGTAKD